eukprot:scaffold97765_cov35-Prasinocladus_malaysianus.AAC.1
MEQFKAGELSRVQGLAKSREEELRDARESLTNITQIAGPLLRSVLERNPDKRPKTFNIDDISLGERIKLLGECLTSEHHSHTQLVLEKDGLISGLRAQLESVESGKQASTQRHLVQTCAHNIAYYRMC